MKPLRQIIQEEKMSDNARELVLFADNDEPTYTQSKVPILNNLKKKAEKGEYDSEKAKKLWGYHADRAAQNYHKQLGSKEDGPWHKMFSVKDRKQAAEHWEDAHRNGEE